MSGGIQLLKADAEFIAKKLGAELKQGGKHIRVTIRYSGRIVLTYGIRHSKKAGHPHICKQLKISASQATSLAKCTMSKDQYFSHLDIIGILPKDI